MIGAAFLFILLQLATFLSLWDWLCRQFIPKDLHPVAIAALGTALLWWSVGSIFLRFLGKYPTDEGKVGWATACFFMSMFAAILALGDQACGAGLLVVLPTTAALGWWWWRKILYDRTSMNDDDRLIGIMLIALLLLSIPAHFLNW